MGQVLYRKYRSKDLSEKELVGQSHITDGLSRSILSGHISHAYLFTGPKGTGKTSVARIVAHMINDFEYDDPCSHLDIIEIDAASNRRIDEIRDLREKVHIAPTTGKYKVYIIDEVHMLTKEAFNALLKTLEEPPAHAVFILATTELHKVPETIISRTQRYAFKPIEKKKIVDHLASIAKKEKIEVDTSALELIADHANGGFRDAISLLDQISNGSSKVSVETVSTMIGIPPKSLISSLWQSINESNPEASAILLSLYDLGYLAPKIAKELLVLAIESRRVDVAEKLLDVRSSNDPELKLQLLVIENSGQAKVKIKEPAKSSATIQQTEVDSIPDGQLLKSINETKKVVTSTVQKDELVNNIKKEAEPNDTNVASTNNSWEEVIQNIKDAGHSVYGPLRLAETEISDGVLYLRLKFPFHIKRIADPQNSKIIIDAYRQVTGKSIKVEVSRLNQEVIDETNSKPPTTKIPKHADINDTTADMALMSDPLDIVRNVFGNAEVL